MNLAGYLALGLLFFVVGFITAMALVAYGYMYQSGHGITHVGKKRDGTAKPS